MRATAFRVLVGLVMVLLGSGAIACAPDSTDGAAPAEVAEAAPEPAQRKASATVHFSDSDLTRGLGLPFS